MPRRNNGARLRWIDRRQSYYIVWYERGRERLRATGETDERRAEEALATWIRKNQRPVGGPRPAHEVKIGEVLDYYADNKGRFAKDPARIGYAIDALLPYWADKAITDISDGSCAEYVLQRARKPGTTRRELTTLRAAVNYAVGRISDESRPVGLPAKPPGKDRWMTRSEAARLLNAARVSRSDVRLYLPLFILLGLYTGARKEAILSLRWAQIDLQAKRINFRRGDETTKGRAHNRLPDRLVAALRRAHRRRFSDLGLLFYELVPGKNGELVQRQLFDIGGAWNGESDSFVQGSFGRACKRAGIVGVTPHTLRHTCGTWMAQQGVPLRLIGEYLGHSDERTTKLYAHHHPDYQDEAVAAFNRRR
jgi:integrase